MLTCRIGFLQAVVFGIDLDEVDGRILDPVCRDPLDPHRVLDKLLWWNFRQSVLANMRGAGEPVFEHDFPPGTDMVKELREGLVSMRDLSWSWRPALVNISLPQSPPPLYPSLQAEYSSNDAMGY